MFAAELSVTDDADVFPAEAEANKSACSAASLSWKRFDQMQLTDLMRAEVSRVCSLIYLIY